MGHIHSQPKNGYGEQSRQKLPTSSISIITQPNFNEPKKAESRSGSITLTGDPPMASPATKSTPAIIMISPTTTTTEDAKPLTKHKISDNSPNKYNKEPKTASETNLMKRHKSILKAIKSRKKKKVKPFIINKETLDALYKKYDNQPKKAPMATTKKVANLYASKSVIKPKKYEILHSNKNNGIKNVYISPRIAEITTTFWMKNIQKKSRLDQLVSYILVIY